MRVPVTRFEIIVSSTPAGVATVHVSPATTMSPAPPAETPATPSRPERHVERKCPGAPSRRTRQVKRHLEEMESSDDEELVCPPTNRRLSFEEDREDPFECCARVLCPNEIECRAAMAAALALPCTVTNRAFCVQSALTDFAKTFPTGLQAGEECRRVYMLEAPAMGLTGFLKLRATHARQFVVEQFGFLPWSPSNLGLLIEGVNLALISRCDWFRELQSIYIVQPEEGELRCGLPVSSSDSDYLVGNLRCLERQGFLAHAQVNDRDEFVDIDVSCVGSYRGYLKTRLEALWRMVDRID